MLIKLIVEDTDSSTSGSDSHSMTNSGLSGIASRHSQSMASADDVSKPMATTTTLPNTPTVEPEQSVINSCTSLMEDSYTNLAQENFSVRSVMQRLRLKTNARRAEQKLSTEFQEQHSSEVNPKDFKSKSYANVSAIHDKDSPASCTQSELAVPCSGQAPEVKLVDIASLRAQPLRVNYSLGSRIESPAHVDTSGFVTQDDGYISESEFITSDSTRLLGSIRSNNDTHSTCSAATQSSSSSNYLAVTPQPFQKPVGSMSKDQLRREVNADYPPHRSFSGSTLGHDSDRETVII